MKFIVSHCMWSSLVCYYSSVCVCKSMQLCPTLCDPMDRSPPGSSVHDILQARILMWVAMPSSKGSSQPKDWTCVFYVSCIGRQVHSVGNESTCNTEEGFDPWIGKIPWTKERLPTPVFWPGEFHGLYYIVHGVTKNWTQLSDSHFLYH